MADEDFTAAATTVRPVVAVDQAVVALNANYLASLFLGGTTTAALAESGRVHELKPAGLFEADRLFATPRKPWCPREC